MLRAFDPNGTISGEIGWKKPSFWEKLKFLVKCSSLNDLGPFLPYPLHCCGLIFWERKMAGGRKRKDSVASSFSPNSYNLLYFLWINRFSFPGISKHLFSNCRRHYVHWIPFWNNEILCFGLWDKLCPFKIFNCLSFLFPTFWMSEVGFPALIQITGIWLYIRCKSLCIHNPSL